jgi:hypothetical protein
MKNKRSTLRDKGQLSNAFERAAMNMLHAEAAYYAAQAEVNFYAAKLITHATEKITLRELARRTGFSASYLSAIKTGKQKISSQAFIRIAGMIFPKVCLNACAFDEERKLAKVPARGKFGCKGALKKHLKSMK